MQSDTANVFTRDDTFLGVCQAIGEDFGFHPNYLPVALAVALFLNPLAVIVAYFTLGLGIALLRWLVPNPRVAPAAAAPIAQNDEEGEELAAAA